MKKFVGAAFGLFLLGAVLGAVLAGPMAHILNPMVQGVREEALQMRHESAGAVGIALFANNLRVSLYMMVGGVLFGIIPFFGVLINGSLIGFVVRGLSVDKHANPILIILAGILPHGIFEITGYCLASGFGLWLGWQTVRTLAGRATAAEWKRILRTGLYTLASILVLLIIAAYVESHITPILLRSALG